MPISAPIDSQHKAHLVSIANEEENDFVLRLVHRKIAWLGGTKLRDGTWLWIDGSVWSYENWRLGEPNDHYSNEDSLIMNCAGNKSGNWCDFNGNTRKPSGYVCQYTYGILILAFAIELNCTK